MENLYFPYETTSGIQVSDMFHILASEDITDIIPLFFSCFSSSFLILETLISM